jgi:CDGSH-type Zn-finger protein
MNDTKKQKPKITNTTPIKVKLEKGKMYGFCTCGYTLKSPFCDSAHKEQAPEYKSLKFTAIKDGDAWLCQCKLTKTPPFCDGSHKKL